MSAKGHKRTLYALNNFTRRGTSIRGNRIFQQNRLQRRASIDMHQPEKLNTLTIADTRQKNEEAAWGQAASKRTSRLGTEGNLSGKNPYATSVAHNRAKARRSSSRRR